MCGIAGILYQDISRHAERNMVTVMCSVIRHRGPDEEGIWTEGPVGIGMRRLSIIDLAGGSQPIFNEDKTIGIVFNGEIYNFRELKDQLLTRGHHFVTHSDTEVIVHLYEDFGGDCVERLRGMFSFAIWDGKRNQLFLARDRFGKKPLYYYHDQEKFLFGSEIKSILQCKDVPREMSPAALIHYLPLGYVPDPETMFLGIRKLPPGHTMTVRNGDLRVRQYWDLQFHYEEDQPEEYYIERILQELEEAVRIRLVSDVPLGAFLSGGLDSSLVVALMARCMSEPVKTFSIGFENQSYNELPYARIVAEEFGTDHHEEIVRPDSENIIDELVRAFDEPFADSSAIPTYYVSKMARNSVTVVLSGDGGDELFGGYERYTDGWIGKIANIVPDPVRMGFLATIGRLIPEWGPGVNMLRSIATDDTGRYLRKITKGIVTIHDRIYSKEIHEQAANTDPSPLLLEYLKRMKHADELTKRMYLDVKTYLPGDILTKVDRASMWASLETRAPFLDHIFAEFAATIPPDLKLHGITTKYILKKAAERILPKEVVFRKKQGFAIPIRFWIRDDWSEKSQELILGDRALARKNFNEGFLRNLVAEHKLRRRDNSYLLWTLMILELWHREYIDNISPL